MPEAAQFEPDDKRLRPITAADSTLWSLATFVVRYRLPLGIGAGVVLVAVIAWLMVSHARENDLISAAQALAAAKSKHSTPDLQEVITRWPGSDAAAQALFEIERAQYDGGDFAKAAETCRSFLSQFPKHFLTSTMQLTLGTALEAKGDLAQAINAYQDLLRNFPNSPEEAQAHLGQGRCYELQGEWEKAKQAYSNISRDSSWADFARERLMVVGRHLNAAATPPTAAPATTPTTTPGAPPAAPTPPPAPATPTVPPAR